MNGLIGVGLERAEKIIKNCMHDSGLKASAESEGYTEVWARDSMITLLGVLLLEDRAISKALKNSINTLRKNQNERGCIPNNVDTETGDSDFQAYADGGLWFVVGNYFLFRQTGDREFLRANWNTVKKVMEWYEYQDVDGTGFLTMSEASDWEDLLAVRGKGLYVNVLYYLSILCAGKMAEVLDEKKKYENFTEKAERLKKLINRHFWYDGDGNIVNNIELNPDNPVFNERGLDKLGRKREVPDKKILSERKYYLPYLSFRNFGEWFDSFGNILSILTGIAERDRAEEILGFIMDFDIAEPYPVKSIYPPIFPEDEDWRYYYRFADLNLPYRYHNGGIWPFLGGFYVAALVYMRKYREAENALESLAEANRKGKVGEWEFNEWLHGEIGKPMGMSGQAWSAGMFIFAERAVRKKKVPFFSDLLSVNNQ